MPTIQLRRLKRPRIKGIGRKVGGVNLRQPAAAGGHRQALRSGTRGGPAGRLRGRRPPKRWHR